MLLSRTASNKDKMFGQQRKLYVEAVVSKGKEKENQQPGGVDPNMLLS